MRKCDKCDSDLQVDWIYCRKCGFETKDSQTLQRLGLAENQDKSEGYRGHTHQSTETYKIQTYSYWVNTQRRLCDTLGLSKAKKAFGKYCEVCGSNVSTRSHISLCKEHKAEWQRERHRRNQATYIQRKRGL